MQRMTILTNGVASIEDDIMTKEILSRGLKGRDPMVYNDIMPLIKPGDWVVDGGAAVGDHAAAYLDAVGPEGKVICFEPSPEFFKCLSYNCPRAELHESVLWHQYEELYLHLAPGNIGASQVKNKPPQDKNREFIGPLNVTILDTMKLPRLDFVKLDLEGSETFAILGMKKTIQKFRPKMVVEVNKPAMQSYGLVPAQLHSLLASLGYRRKSIRNQKGENCENCDILCTFE